MKSMISVDDMAATNYDWLFWGRRIWIAIGILSMAVILACRIFVGKDCDHLNIWMIALSIMSFCKAEELKYQMVATGFAREIKRLNSESSKLESP